MIEVGKNLLQSCEAQLGEKEVSLKDFV